jgi:hypothetical protein
MCPAFNVRNAFLGGAEFAPPGFSKVGVGDASVLSRRSSSMMIGARAFHWVIESRGIPVRLIL